MSRLYHEHSKAQSHVIVVQERQSTGFLMDEGLAISMSAHGTLKKETEKKIKLVKGLQKYMLKEKGT